jgi:hypothetical protein
MYSSREDGVQDSHAYQRDLNRLKNHLQASVDRADRGEPAAPFDVEDVKRRGRERLALVGITE